MKVTKLVEESRKMMKKIALITILLMFIGSISVVFAAPAVKDLSITSYSVSPNPLVIGGENNNVELKIKNGGTQNIVAPSQIEIQVCKPNGTGCHIPNGAEIGTLVAGQEKTYNLGFVLSENDVVNGNTLIKIVVDGDNQVAETDETNNQQTVLVPAVEAGADVKFSVSVNDYPDHQDYSLSKNLNGAYVNMYTVVLEGDAFRVVGTKTKSTGTSRNPSAEFTISSGEMVYFEGFKTLIGAQEGAEEKQSFLWSAPPYKNFGNGKLCQTHWTETNEFLRYSEDSACSTSLSTSYKDQVVALSVPVVESDLKAAGLDYDQTSFKGKVCNLGSEGVSGVKVRFVANGKENVLTYAPTIPASDCVDLYSWGYSYFGISADEQVSAKFYVDPNNDITETNENNNKISLSPSIVDNTGREMTYPVFTRSKDESAKGIVAKYVLQNGWYSLVDTKYATLQDSYISTPNGGSYGESYYAEMTLKTFEAVTLVAFYPNSEIPETLRNLPAVVPKFSMNYIDGKAVACKSNGDCSVTYGNHAQELFWYEDGEFMTIYSHPDLFNREINTPLPVYERVNEVEQSNPLGTKCVSSCSYEGKCIPIGTKIKPDGIRTGLYCDWEGEMVSQKSVGKSCQNDYECSTNGCMSGSCVDLQQQLQKQQNLLEKILNWLNSLF
jgi:hypothetical protein